MHDGTDASEAVQASNRNAIHRPVQEHTCFMGCRMTGWSPRSDLPLITSSFDRTVPSAGHQLTGTSAW